MDPHSSRPCCPRVNCLFGEESLGASWRGWCERPLTLFWESRSQKRDPWRSFSGLSKSIAEEETRWGQGCPPETSPNLEKLVLPASARAPPCVDTSPWWASFLPYFHPGPPRFSWRGGASLNYLWVVAAWGWHLRGKYFLFFDLLSVVLEDGVSPENTFYSFLCKAEGCGRGGWNV